MIPGRGGTRWCTACVVLSLVAGPAPLFALDPDKRLTQFVHTAWTPRDGAPSDIRSIAQTPDGYLWLGTPTAIYRFDGIRFVRWSPPAEWAHLAERTTGALLVTRDGVLWAGLGGGVARIHGSAFSWRPVASDSHVVTGMVEEDDHGLLVVASGSGLYRFDRRSDVAAPLSTDDGLAGGIAFKVWKDREQTIWVVEDGVWPGATSNLPGDPSKFATESTIVYRPAGARTFQLTHLELGTIGGFAQGADGAIWVSELPRAVRLLRSASGRFVPPGPEVRMGSTAPLVDRHGSLWIPTLGDGLRRIADVKTIRHAIVDKVAPPSLKVEPYADEHGLSGDVLFTSFEDREGNLWFGSANGLDRFREVSLAEFSAKEGVRLNMLSASVAPAPDGGVLVATYLLNGIVLHVDRSGNVSSQHVYVNAAGTTAKDCAVGGGNPIHALYRAPDGVLWAAGTRLYKQEREQWRCLPLVTADGPIEVKSLTTDARGGLWLGTERNGLWHYGADGALTKIAASGRRRVTMLLSRPDGGVWLGSADGMARLQGEELIDVDFGPVGARGLQTLFAGSGDDVWVLSAAGALLVRDGRVASPPGLATVPVGGCWYAVRAGDDLWFNCPQGLLKITEAEWARLGRNLEYRPSYEWMEATDDLRSAPIRAGTGGSLTWSDGRVWFLTRNGIGYVDPRRADRTRHPPPVYIEGAHVGDAAVDVGADRAQLPPLSNALEVSFTAIRLSHPERLRFRYRLEGADEDWRETREHTVSYSNLPAGDYRLRVLAVDHLGTWSDREAVWRFSVAPRWYERWWFRLSVLTSTVFLVWLAVTIGFARQAARLKREFSVQLGERTRIAGELHDTLLQGFQGTTLLLHVVESALPRDSPERKQLHGLLAEQRRVIDEGRNAIWAIRQSATAGDDLAAAFARVVEHSAASGPAFNLIEEGRRRPMKPMQQDTLYLLGREALLNALQHSGGAHIQMTLRWEPRWFRMAVGDDGRGMAEDVLRRGRDGHFGLAGMRERAERLGARFEVRSAPGRGTEVLVEVPAASIYLRPHLPWYRGLLASAPWVTRRSPAESPAEPPSC